MLKYIKKQNTVKRNYMLWIWPVLFMICYTISLFYCYHHLSHPSLVNKLDDFPIESNINQEETIQKEIKPLKKIKEEPCLGIHKNFEPIRDFNKQPVTIQSNSNKDWTNECAIPCLHTTSASTFDLYQTQYLLTMESSVYYPSTKVDAAHASGIKVVMTPSLSSDVPVGYFSWAEYAFQTQPLPYEQKSNDFDAVCFISNCSPNSFRMIAIEKMERLGIRIDKYGSCFGRRSNLKKEQVMGKYKFTLAFENSIEEDYVTEKYFQTLVVGSVPVVIGADNIKDFEPMPNSLLHIPTEADIESVVERMKYLLKNQSAYSEMLQWKELGPNEKFLALVDMAVVHSSCRLCLHVAIKLQFTKPALNECPKTDKSQRHLWIRERGTFDYFLVPFCQPFPETIEQLYNRITSFFMEKQYKPIWVGHRQDYFNSKEQLKIWRIYDSTLTQRKALYGSAEEDGVYNTDQKVQKLFSQSTSCPFLEVIFV